MEGPHANHRSRLVFVGLIAIAGMVALVIVLVSGDDKDNGGASTADLPPGCQAVDEPTGRDVKLREPDLKAPPPGSTATVSTSCGDFTIELATAQAPKTTASFVNLADNDVYKDVAFTRIAPGFVIQGGDPTGTQSGNAGYTVTEPPPANVTYSSGTVAMAKSGAEPPGTSGSQFFVVTAPADAGLPPDYALLGKVSTGMDVVERIASIGTANGADGPPKSPVVINSVTISNGDG
ncbi:MAG: peptidylprolyl isomerase [Solirubrobacterales bacterium]